MIRAYIVDILKRLLDLFEDKTSKIEAWPFPAVSEDFEPRPKRKPTVKKATTRTTKKPAVVAKTARKKTK